LGYYGVELTRHGGDGVERRAGEGDKDCFDFHEFRELMVFEDGELN